MQTNFTWINGRLVEQDAASISIRDAGLLHGAGAFTTMRARYGKIFRLDQHLARLRQSCETLFIPLRFDDSALREAIRQLLQVNQLSDARLRLTNTRGLSRRDPVHGLALEPNCFLSAVPLEPYDAGLYERGMIVIALDEQKLNPYDIQAGHKTLDYLSRLTALSAASKRGAGEALWFNVHNYLQSGSITNIFLIHDGRLTTPPTQAEIDADSDLRRALPYPRSNVLPGITRAAVIELAEKKRLTVELAGIDVNQLLSADEIFLTNSIMDLMPVRRIEQHIVGNDKPGEITLGLMADYNALVSGDIVDNP